MKRICIIGDSHVGALKQGWDDVRERHPDVELTFFTTPGAHTGDMVLDGGAITGRTEKVRETFAYSSGGLEAVVPADYDRFAVVAMGVGIRTVLMLYTRYRLDAHRGYKSPNFVSPALFRDLARAALGKANATRVRNLLGTVTSAPVDFVPEPLPSEDLPTTESYDEALRAIFTGGFDGDVAAVYDNLVEEMRVGGAAVVTQPEATQRSTSLTKREYSVGSVRVVGSKHPTDERLHMNRQFGALIIERLLAA